MPMDFILIAIGHILCSGIINAAATLIPLILYSRNNASIQAKSASNKGGIGSLL
jgi:hypothetical protein